MIVKKEEESYYVFRKTVSFHANRNHEHREKSLRRNYRRWFFVKHSFDGRSESGVVCFNVGDIHFPKEFVGKRIVFKVEVLK